MSNTQHSEAWRVSVEDGRARAEGEGRTYADAYAQAILALRAAGGDIRIAHARVLYDPRTADGRPLV